jgi:succinate dehydrogenase / fumarate reductase iron-sulfur subunit
VRLQRDRIIQRGGYVSLSTGGAPDGNDIPIGKSSADHAMDAAACVGCGACVAACSNASSSLSTGAKITHLGKLPQGQPESDRRVIDMVEQMDVEGFGNCSWFGECQEACPQGDQPRRDQADRPRLRRRVGTHFGYRLSMRTP